MSAPAPVAPPAWHLYVPKLVSVMRQGYGADDLRHDLLAGLTVAIVALPLSMALAIASGAPPAIGLHTAIIAGFLISALGGSRVQIGGPTAAFIPVVFSVIAAHGYDGLIVATLMAGAMLILAGLLRLGTMVKYMPQPVITGFTAGIAVSIFSSQIKDLLGLDMGSVPGTFVERWQAYGANIGSINPAAALLALGTLGALIAMRRWRPNWPGFLIAVVAASLITLLLKLPVETVLTHFGPIPRELPVPHLPSFDIARLHELLPSAFTIAFLGGVESLLSAVVSDGMIGGRHRSNCELVAQGVANTASALVGGLPATGAIVRTATNVRAGARSPVAGMAHAGFILLFVLVAAPLANYVPLPAMAALLLLVAWNMSEFERIRQLMRSPLGERLVLLVTFLLTVMVDLTLAVEVGVVLAAFLFMRGMSEVVAMESHIDLFEEDEGDLTRERRTIQHDALPDGVEAFRVSGPLFFAVANRIEDVLRAFGKPPRVFILRLRQVPLIDASGATSIGNLIARCRRTDTVLIFTGLQPQPARILADMGIVPDGDVLRYADDFPQALAMVAAMPDWKPD
ncbi:MAG TPA: SulP family inorganic anion transporter [Dokdonella sp.]|uniref:SulP family inorganic anion transporter n=2 Tax=Dokdonella sp. TaxID=2291710 RepID=UPI002C3023F0|nr:SulP family inorganic anion transporter [Dokdonella sp.]HOX72463.1 SulP family inorganic anion transporter [Dokdonella sp.]